MAELVGTFALVAIGAGAGCLSVKTGIVGIALAHGLILAAMINAVGHVSGGHFNPAVSFAMWITGKIKMVDTAFYVLFQLLGAVLAGYFLKWVCLSSDMSLVSTGNLGATTLNIPVFPGLICEIIGTFLLVTIIFGAAVDGRSAGNTAGLTIGLGLAGLILCFGLFTGAAFNPARSFGPALAANCWPKFWVYILGPVIGASLAALLQTQFFMKHK